MIQKIAVESLKTLSLKLLLTALSTNRQQALYTLFRQSCQLSHRSLYPPICGLEFLTIYSSFFLFSGNKNAYMRYSEKKSCWVFPQRRLFPWLLSTIFTYILLAVVMKMIFMLKYNELLYESSLFFHE